MSDRPPDFFMRCVFEVLDPVEDARGAQNLKGYPEARRGLYGPNFSWGVGDARVLWGLGVVLMEYR